MICEIRGFENHSSAIGVRESFPFTPSSSTYGGSSGAVATTEDPMAGSRERIPDIVTREPPVYALSSARMACQSSVGWAASNRKPPHAIESRGT